MSVRGFLLLEDGSLYPGEMFGAIKKAVGEIVFTTAMVGYTESLTDPSYRGQILMFTYPLLGNYGVPSMGEIENGIPLHFESSSIQVRGMVISKLMRGHHPKSVTSLEQWLAQEGVPGIEGLDTRTLTKKIREKGVMMAAIVPEEEDIEKVYEEIKRTSYERMNLAAEVSPGETVIHSVPGYRGTVVVLDCGVKHGILRELLKRKLRVVRVPYHADIIRMAEEYNASGVLISNGPGRPDLLKEPIKNAEAIIEYNIPTLGICLGSQIIAMASGARIYKMKYGHRGINKPVKDLKSGRGFVTTQNHGYAIKWDDTEHLNLWMRNLDDGTPEGFYHPKKPVIATQFHPEGSPGPLDSLWVFDLFVSMLERGKHGL